MLNIFFISGNFLNIIFVIFGLFGVHHHRTPYLFTYTIWTLGNIQGFLGIRQWFPSKSIDSTGTPHLLLKKMNIRGDDS